MQYNIEGVFSDHPKTLARYLQCAATARVRTLLRLPFCGTGYGVLTCLCLGGTFQSTQHSFWAVMSNLAFSGSGLSPAQSTEGQSIANGRSLQAGLYSLHIWSKTKVLS